MGWKEDALNEPKKVGNFQSVIKSNYLFCPRLCKKCEFFSETESNFPYSCDMRPGKARNDSVAYKSADGHKKFSQYDDCPAFENREEYETSDVKKNSNGENDSWLGWIGLLVFVIFIITAFIKSINNLYPGKWGYIIVVLSLIIISIITCIIVKNVSSTKKVLKIFLIILLTIALTTLTIAHCHFTPSKKIKKERKIEIEEKSNIIKKEPLK